MNPLWRFTSLGVALLLTAGCGTRTAPLDGTAPEPAFGGQIDESSITEAPEQEDVSTLAGQATVEDASTPAMPDTASEGTPGNRTEEPTSPSADRQPTDDRQQPASDANGFQRVGHVVDRVGDAGVEAPGYADITSVTVEDDGERARLTVDVAGTIPSQLADGEVLGVGIDFFTNSGAESDYQVYAVGNADGWEAFLQNANGLFEHPGELVVGGSRTVVFELDWSFLGQLPEGSFSAFIDWSQRRTLVNAVGRDRAPDSGTAPFRR